MSGLDYLRTLPPDHLRPDSWPRLCDDLEAAGVDPHHAERRLDRAIARARGPALLVAEVRDLIADADRRRDAATPVPRGTAPGLILEVHEYVPDSGDYSCARCGLPRANRHHSTLRAV